MPFRKKTALWLCLIGITGLVAQLLFTVVLWDRLSFEEIAESIRNPYWVSQGTIYDGISSNVVYYKALDVFYQLRGFHLFAAKEFRFILSLVSITAIGIVLYQMRVAGKAPLVGFLAWVLSPTLLLFGTCQASFGIDLQVFPIIGAIWFFSLRTHGMTSAVLLFTAIFLTVLMGAAFPPGLFYLPALLLVDWLVRVVQRRGYRQVLTAFIGRIIPAALGVVAGLAVPFLLVEDRLLLFYDSNTGAGLFRGGGKLSLHPIAFVNSLWRSFQDIFIEGSSYEFYLPNPEFGSVLSVASLLAMLILLFKAGSRVLRKTGKGPVELAGMWTVQVALFAFILFLTFLILSHLSPNLPGLRRSAGMLVAFYLLYFLCLEVSSNALRGERTLFNKVLFSLLCLLPLSHGIQATRNLQVLPDRVTNEYPAWLKGQPSASESLASLYQEIADGRALTCSEVPPGCRYSAPFAALKLYHRNTSQTSGDLEVFAEDPVSGEIIPVRLSLWADYYWIH